MDMTEDSIIERLKEVILDYMPETAASCRVESEYHEGGSSGPHLSLLDAQGKEFGHPVELELCAKDPFAAMDWLTPYTGKIRECFDALRASDEARNRPLRNLFTMTVHRDGSYEAEFIHDPELDARRLAELEEKEHRRVEKAKEAWEALSDEEKAQVMAQEKE